MLVASRSNKKERDKVVWIRLNPKDDNNNAISADEYLKMYIGNDIAQETIPKSGKNYYRCKTITIFNCKHRLRSFKSETTGETVLEECGMHVHNVST